MLIYSYCRKSWPKAVEAPSSWFAHRAISTRPRSAHAQSTSTSSAWTWTRSSSGDLLTSTASVVDSQLAPAHLPAPSANSPPMPEWGEFANQFLNKFRSVADGVVWLDCFSLLNLLLLLEYCIRLLSIIFAICNFSILQFYYYVQFLSSKSGIRALRRVGARFGLADHRNLYWILNYSLIMYLCVQLTDVDSYRFSSKQNKNKNKKTKKQNQTFNITINKSSKLKQLLN